MGAFRVVRCPSCVFNNFFKHLLLPNHWANLDQTWKECSLGGPLQNLFTEFDSIKNSGCHGNEIEFFQQFLKNLLRNLLKNCSRNFDPSINMAVVNGGFLHYINMKKFLKDLLFRNHWSGFEIISQECSFCDPFQKLFAKFWSAQNHGSG